MPSLPLVLQSRRTAVLMGLWVMPWVQHLLPLPGVRPDTVFWVKGVRSPWEGVRLISPVTLCSTGLVSPGSVQPAGNESKRAWVVARNVGSPRSVCPLTTRLTVGDVLNKVEEKIPCQKRTWQKPNQWIEMFLFSKQWEIAFRAKSLRALSPFPVFSGTGFHSLYCCYSPCQGAAEV